MKKYRLKKAVLPVGTVFEHPAPLETRRAPGLEWYEVIVALGRDHSAKFTVDSEAIERNPDYFEEITDDESEAE